MLRCIFFRQCTNRIEILQSFPLPIDFSFFFLLAILGWGIFNVVKGEVYPKLGMFCLNAQLAPKLANDMFTDSWDVFALSWAIDFIILERFPSIFLKVKFTYSNFVLLNPIPTRLCHMIYYHDDKSYPHIINMLISKYLFGVFNFLQKTNKNKSPEHTAGSDTIFVQIYMDPPPGIPGVSKDQIFFFTNETVFVLR